VRGTGGENGMELGRTRWNWGENWGEVEGIGENWAVD